MKKFECPESCEGRPCEQVDELPCVRELRAEIERLTQVASPECCGNCAHLNDGTCGDWGDNGPCEEYARATLAGKE